MIALLCVGDGERDAATVPRLVERILGVPIRESCHHWARLHRDGALSGYGRKLAFAARRAKDEGAQGVLATVDADKTAGRLAALRSEREKQECVIGLPIAVAEAIPHGEAWLLDDPQAVRLALRLGGTAEVPSMRKAKSPKEALHALLQRSALKEVRPRDVWADIARQVDPQRCKNATSTGFRGFVEDVTERLGRLAAQVRP